ncbi:hypothetical protein BH11ACT6_BH11ACT6_35060 [soil metagenome]
MDIHAHPGARYYHVMARRARSFLADLRDDLRFLWIALLAQVDSRTVRLFQSIMYFWFAVGGVYGAFVGTAPEIIEQAMGSGVYIAWVWLNIIGPFMVVAGVWLPRVPRSGDRRVREANGLILQFCGDITVFLALAAYVIAILIESYWGRGVYAAFGYMGLTMCAALLAVGDIRKMRYNTEWRASE